MILSVSESLAIIAVVALCTFATRLLPFILFSGKKPPNYVLYLGKYLPAAIISVLVIYCFRNTAVTAWPHGIPEIIAVAAVVLLHLWKRNNLISIGGGTILYMILVQVVFI